MVKLENGRKSVFFYFDHKHVLFFPVPVCFFVFLFFPVLFSCGRARWTGEDSPLPPSEQVYHVYMWAPWTMCCVRTCVLSCVRQGDNALCWHGVMHVLVWLACLGLSTRATRRVIGVCLLAWLVKHDNMLQYFYNMFYMFYVHRCRAWSCLHVTYRTCRTKINMLNMWTCSHVDHMCKS